MHMKQKNKKQMARILTVLLAVAVTVCFVPQMNVPVYAANEGPASMAMGSDALSKDAGKNGAQTVWYAGSAWRVIGYNGGGVASTEGDMTLLASDNLQTGVQFNPYDKYDNDYAGSYLQSVIDALYADRFSSSEKTAVKKRTLEVGEYTVSEPYSTGVSGTATSGYLWPLSTAEAWEMEASDLLIAGDYWWLRSPGGILDTFAAVVYGQGSVGYLGYSVFDSYGVRPAFNLNLKSVLFISAAEGGKSSGAEGAGALKAQSDQTNSGNEWKVTLQSGHDDFELSEYTPTENGVEVKYTGATVGTEDKPEYISAVITDKPITEDGAAIKYYGRIAAASEADGAVTINTAEKLGSGDTLYVFNEQYNGDKKTDYASALQEVTIQKPKLTITAKDQTHEYNGQTQGEGDTVYEDPAQIAEKVTVEGLQADDKLTSIVVDGQGTAVGKYDLVPSNATINEKPASDKYDVTYVNGTLTITQPTPATYTVTFVDGQGKTLKTQKVKSGKAATAPATPKRSGYTFTGWDKDFSKVTADMTVTAQWKKNAEPAPVTKVSGTLLAKMTAKGKSSLVLTWNKVTGVEGYDIFFVRCGNANTPKLVKTIKGNKTFKWTKKSLKKKKAYKAVVKAYVMKNGKKSYVRTSPLVHAYTSGATKNYTNPKSVTVKKTSVSLKAGKTYKIKASVKKIKSGKKLMPSGHAPKLRYLSSNKKIATVSSSGKITAKAKGSCKIYVYAVNGVSKTVKLTVR